MTTRPVPKSASARRLDRIVAVLDALDALEGTVTNASAGGPTFPAGVFADGRPWFTSVTATVEEPTDRDAFDPFYVVTNGDNPAGQPPVAAAGLGNPTYNGGRWTTHTAEWTDAGLAAHRTVPVLTRYGPADDPASILYHEERGHLETTHGPPDGGPLDGDPPLHFRCPLLPTETSHLLSAEGRSVPPAKECPPLPAEE